VLACIVMNPVLDQRKTGSSSWAGSLAQCHKDKHSTHIPDWENLHILWKTQVLKETMRMYTTTPVVARELSEQLEIGGYLLPKVKSRLADIELYCMHFYRLMVLSTCFR